VCAAYKELGQHALFPSGKDLRLLLQQQKQRAAKSSKQKPTATASAAQDVLALPALPGPLTKVAEAPAAYKTVPFTSTNRYFRGRVVDALRALAPGERLSLPELGPQVKADFSAVEDMAWLSRLTEELARDGLIALHHASGEPAGKLQPMESLLLVSLP
jgi:A/G-specific adenine glycosylase